MSLAAASKYVFSANLEQQSIYQIDFLSVISLDRNLHNPDVIRRAIYRYEHLWLPLAADHPKECLSAPLDIEWVWHCHMLSPRAYSTDCVAIVNTVVNHVIRTQADYDKALRKSQTLWNQKYHSVHEPFSVDFSQPFEMQPHMLESRITYDITSAAGRQGVFYYQVSLPHFKDSKFLKSSLLRYKQFLYMKTMLPNDFIVPCYDIDLMWHSHQLNPLAYKNDMMKIIGHLFNHDDNVTDRSPGSKLSNADVETRKNWKMIFNESFSLFGAMYRGNPASGSLSSIAPIEAYGVCTKKAIVSVEMISLEILSNSNDKQTKSLNLHGEMCAENVIMKKWFTTSKQDKTLNANHEFVWHNIGKYEFDSLIANCLKVSAANREGFACFGNREVLGSASINILQHIETIANATGGQIRVSESLNANMKLTANMTYDSPRRGPCYLVLEQGQYETAIIPEQIQSLWGPVSLERLPPGQSNNCLVATHKLKNHVGFVLFTARTIHSAPLMMSVVQIFCKDRMVAIGHLIASDQLPMPFQVNGKNIPTLNPRQGERAVLIKNNDGDWGILTGKWVGLRKGIPGFTGTRYNRGYRGVPGKNGTLALSFYSMVTGKSETVSMGYENELYSVNIGALAVDLMKGVVKIQDNCTTIAEHLVLAFSVSMLHVLCVPRPKDWEKGQSVMTTITRGGRTSTTTPSDSMAFVVASGLLYDTPSNYYFRRRFGFRYCAGCGSCGGYNHVGDFSDHADGLDAAEDGGDIATEQDVDTEVGNAEGGDDGGCGGCGGCGGGCGGGGDSGGCGGGGGGGCGGDGGGCGGGGGGCGGGGNCGGGGGGGGGGDGGGGGGCGGCGG